MWERYMQMFQDQKKKRYGQASWWCLLFDTMLCTKQFLSHFGAAASKGKKEFEKEKEKQKKNKNERAYICVYRMCDSYKSIFTRLGDWVGDQFDMYFQFGWVEIN